MKKRLLLVFAVVFVMGLTLTGCSGGMFGAEASDDGTSVTVTAEEATDDMLAMTGTVTIEKGQKVHVDYDFTDGELAFKLVKQPEEQSIDMSEEELAEFAEAADAAAEGAVSGTGSEDYEVEPGDYSVYANVSKEKLTGTAVFSAK